MADEFEDKKVSKVVPINIEDEMFRVLYLMFVMV